MLFTDAFRRCCLRSLAVLCKVTALCLVWLPLLLSGCGGGALRSTPAGTGEAEVQIKGNVYGGQQPVSQATVQLYAAGTSDDRSEATPLIAAPAVKTDGAGNFNITGRYTCPSHDTPVYLMASGGNPGLPSANNTNLVMITALGPCGNLSASTFVSVNEVTTVGSVFALAPFMGDSTHVGAGHDNTEVLADDFSLVNELVNTGHGYAPGPVPAQGFTVDVAKLYTLADIVASCVNTGGNAVAGDGSICGMLFHAATPPSGTAPTNTVDALLNIANYPKNNVTQIYNLSPSIAPFQPTLGAAPSDWSLVPEPSLVLAGAGSPVGLNSSATGTITLGRAPKTDLSVALVSSNANITVNSPIIIPAGQTTANFTYNGIATGTSTITATAGGYLPASVSLTATDARISLSNVGALSPGDGTDLTVRLDSAAPAGGVTVTLASNNSNVATVSPATVTVPAGSLSPYPAPRITAVGVGTANFTATATNYAAGSSTVSVSVSANLPANLTTAPGTINELLTLSAAAPQGGTTFTLSSSDTNIFTVPATVTVPAGATSAYIAVTGVGTGTATLSVSASGIQTVTSSIHVNASITGDAGVATGAGLQFPSLFALPVTPNGNVDVTVTSNNPAVAVVSMSASTVGSAAIVFTGVNTTVSRTFTVQGVSVGSTTLTISAAGYTPLTIPVTVNPAGFVFGSADFSTSTFSGTKNLPVYAFMLDSTFKPVSQMQTSPALGDVKLTLTSSDANIGTITNSITVKLATSASAAIFTPVGGGQTMLAIAAPAGFSTPASGASIKATVSAAYVNVTSTTLIGAHLERDMLFNLSQSPSSPVTVTVTSDNPAVALVAASGTVVGSATATFTVGNSSSVDLFVQGQTPGTAKLTLSAQGYGNGTLTVTIGASAFVYNNSLINTTTFSDPSDISVQSYTLNAQSGLYSRDPVAPGFAPLSVALTTDDNTIATITGPLTFNAGDSTIFTKVQPKGAGSTNLHITQPAGFSASSSDTTKVNVSAPAIGANQSVRTGVHLQVGGYFNLGTNPPSPVTVTVTSSNPAVATVSANTTTVGTASIQMPNQKAGGTYFQVQGQGLGTATLTFSAPGYTSATTTVTVCPSGVVFNTSAVTTTTFSTQSDVSIGLRYLDSTTLAPVTDAVLNPDITSLTVALTSSDTTVGTINSTLTFGHDQSAVWGHFQPSTAGQTTLSITQPSGFTTPAYSSQIKATVTAPSLSTFATLETGDKLQVVSYASLSQTPPSARDLTVTSNNPAIAIVSKTSSAIGAASVVFSGLTSTSGQTFYLQGVSQGTTTLTISAPGYQSATVSVTVMPSGFVLSTGNFTVNAGAANKRTFYAAPYYLDPATKTPRGAGQLNPATGSVALAMQSSNTAVGTVTNPPAFGVSDTAQFGEFTPISAGQTTVTFAQPPGFTTPNSGQQFTVTVQ